MFALEIPEDYPGDMTAQGMLKTRGLKDTLPRRMVLQALSELGVPSEHVEIHRWILKRNIPVNLVTVYRVIDQFEEKGIVHRHPSTGKILLCSLEEEGHHGFLSCVSCGKVEEFQNPALCAVENSIAKRAGYKKAAHVSDIVGICPRCQ